MIRPGRKRQGLHKWVRPNTSAAFSAVPNNGLCPTPPPGPEVRRAAACWRRRPDSPRSPALSAGAREWRGNTTIFTLGQTPSSSIRCRSRDPSQLGFRLDDRTKRNQEQRVRISCRPLAEKTSWTCATRNECVLGLQRGPTRGILAQHHGAAPERPSSSSVNRHRQFLSAVLGAAPASDRAVGFLPDEDQTPGPRSSCVRAGATASGREALRRPIPAIVGSARFRSTADRSPSSGVMPKGIQRDQRDSARPAAGCGLPVHGPTRWTTNGFFPRKVWAEPDNRRGLVFNVDRAG